MLKQGDIVFANFPYEEDKLVKKPRPCLVLAVRDNRFLAAKITTTKIDRSWVVYLRAGTIDMASGTLRFDSWINLARREWINCADFIFHIGALRDELMQNIKNMLVR